MQVVNKSVEELKEYKNNARTHSEGQITDIIRSIKDFGFNDPIEIDLDNVVISGHARLEAARRSGLKEVPTVCHSHLSEAKKKAYILAANRIAASAGWDNWQLTSELKVLEEEGIDLSLTGFTSDEINALMNVQITEGGLCDPDESPEIKKSTITCKGDVWVLGVHRLICGDSTNILDVEKLIQKNEVHLVYTDPPYGINEKTDRHRSKRTQVAKAGSYDRILGDDNTQAAIGAYNLCEGLNFPIMVWWGANYYCHSLPESGNWLVWDKRETDNNQDCNSDCELAWVKSKSNSVRIFRHLWKGMIKASEQGQGRVHPTQKPIALAEWCFNNYARGATTVLDLFGGSGTTLIACEKTARKCLMMELDEKYCDVIIRRWQKFTGGEAYLEETGVTFNDRDREEARTS